MSLTVPADGDRTVRLKLLTGIFTLGRLLYRQTVRELWTETANRTVHTGSLTVPADGGRTLRLKLVTGPFRLGHLPYRQTVIELRD